MSKMKSGVRMANKRKRKLAKADKKGAEGLKAYGEGKIKKGVRKLKAAQKKRSKAPASTMMKNPIKKKNMGDQFSGAYGGKKDPTKGM